MPVQRAGLRQLVLEDHADPVALGHLDRRARRRPVEAPHVDRLVGRDLALEDVRGQPEDLYFAIHLEGQVTHIGGDDADVVDRAAVRLHLGKRPAGDSQITAPGGYLTCWIGSGMTGFGGGTGGKQPGTEAKGTLKKRTAIRHDEEALRVSEKALQASSGGEASAEVQSCERKADARSPSTGRVVRGRCAGLKTEGGAQCDGSALPRLERRASQGTVGAPRTRGCGRCSHRHQLKNPRSRRAVSCRHTDQRRWLQAGRRRTPREQRCDACSREIRPGSSVLHPGHRRHGGFLPGSSVVRARVTPGTRGRAPDVAS